MASSKKIGLQILDDELLNLINASTKIFPITQNDVDNKLNPNGYEFGKVQDIVNNVTNIYSWHTDDLEWVKVGAEDKTVDWNNDVKNKPSTYPPSTHTHTEYASTTHNHDTVYQTKGDYAASIHTHTEYAPSTHDHDGRYATPAQLVTKADITHNHDGVYATNGHNHDTLYAVKSTETTVSDHETRLSNIESGYSTGHSHSNLTTLNKITYTGINPTVDLKGIEDNTSALANKSDVGHTHTEYSPTTHNHSGVYQPVGNYATTTDLSNKVDTTTYNGHTGNTTVHVSQAEKDTWNAKQKAFTVSTTAPSSPVANDIWIDTN